ncbi:MAG: winged helix-turn-helix domain-containing protein [Cyanobacteria bacterium REEB65]|nr:winged helix-turn-helix domain-containing protein [Cyanobacteria bacterium REEB65]
MARLATTTDVFNAISEPRRRQILELLAPRERSVSDVARILAIPQPQVSKHLKVLKAVGLVTVRGEGKQHLYSLNGGALKPVHDWTAQFQAFWGESFDRLDILLAELQQKEKSRDNGE